MTAHNSKSYLAYLNKLVDQCNNTQHYSINKKRINTDYSALSEEYIRIFLVKATLKVGQKNYLLSFLC